MAATHSTKWFWSDWLGDPEVRRLNPAERGMWIDLLALAAIGSPVGYVCDDRGRSLSHDEIRRVTNAADIAEVTKLIAGILEKGAASRDRAGRLFNRRMVREAELSAKRKRNGRLGGERTALLWRELKGLPQQTARQTLGRPEPPLILSKKITSSESGTAREEESGQPSGDVSEELASLIHRRRA